MTKKTHTYTMYRIIQIMPAQPKWEAVFVSDEEDGGMKRVPLICWALVETLSSEQRQVIGMTPRDSAPELMYVDWGDFLGYNYPGCDIDWEATAKAYRET